MLYLEATRLAVCFLRLEDSQERSCCYQILYYEPMGNKILFDQTGKGLCDSSKYSFAIGGNKIIYLEIKDGGWAVLSLVQTPIMFTGVFM